MKTPKIHGLARGTLDYLRPFYLGTQSGSQKSRYVLWVDIMGSQGKMLRNVRTASIPLMKLHVAALNAKKKTIGDIDLFPVIDGIYVVSEYFSAIIFFISDVFRSMGAEFLVLKNWERSVIRGAVAYGPVGLPELVELLNELAVTKHSIGVVGRRLLVECFGYRIESEHPLSPLRQSRLSRQLRAKRRRL